MDTNGSSGKMNRIDHIIAETDARMPDRAEIWCFQIKIFTDKSSLSINISIIVPFQNTKNIIRIEFKVKKMKMIIDWSK